MKHSRFSETDIVHILELADQGEAIADLCDRYHLSVPAFYKWRAKYRGLDIHKVRRLRELELENKALKKRLKEERYKKSLLQQLVKDQATKPAIRSQMAATLVAEGKMSIRAACQLLEISETCYRYQQHNE